jgi:bile acid:Na+ symporter, BASS family
VTVPLLLTIVSWLFIEDASIAPLEVTRLVTVLFLLPLTLGSVLRRIAPELMARASGAVIAAANILLLVVAASLINDLLPALQQLGLGFGVALAGLSLCAVSVGHVAGGSARQDSSALAVMSASRHPGFALVAAHCNFHGDLVLPAVVASFVIGTLVSLPYAFWCRHRRRSTVVSVPIPTPAVEGPS